MKNKYFKRIRTEFFSILAIKDQNMSLLNTRNILCHDVSNDNLIRRMIFFQKVYSYESYLK